MITKMITKDDDKKLKGQSKNEFKMFKIESRTLQDSRRKGYSRIKKKLNQDKYEKVFSKTEQHMDFSQNMFTKEFLLSGNRLPDYCNRLPVA